TFLLTKGSVDFTINLPSSCFLAGDRIHVNLDMVNSTSKAINEVTVKLIQKITLFMRGSKVDEKDFELASHQLGGLKASEEKHPNFILPVPTSAPESIFLRDLKNGRAGKCINISYLVSHKKGSFF